MAVMSKATLKNTIRNIGKAREKLQEAIQEALIACTYYAMKDGNTETFNQLLSAVGNATRIKGITMWAETFAPVLVRDGEFVLNKTAKNALDVKSEEDFAPYEADMRAGAKWYEIAGEQKAQSMFDPVDYLERVMKHLRKHGVDSDVIAAVERAEVLARVIKTKAEEGEAGETGATVDGEAVRIDGTRQLANV